MSLKKSEQVSHSRNQNKLQSMSVNVVAAAAVVVVVAAAFVVVVAAAAAVVVVVASYFAPHLHQMSLLRLSLRTRTHNPHCSRIIKLMTCSSLNKHNWLIPIKEMLF